MTPLEALRAMPTSSIPLFTVYNHNWPGFSDDVALEHVRVCGGVAVRWDSQDGWQNAKRWLGQHPGKLCVYVQDLKFGGMAKRHAALVRAKCERLRDLGCNPDYVVLHHEGPRVPGVGCNAYYAAIMSVWPHSLVSWYNCPGYHLSPLGAGDVATIPDDALRDLESCSLYGESSAEAQWQLAQCSGDGRGQYPWLSLMGTYRDIPGQPTSTDAQKRLGWAWMPTWTRSQHAQRNIGKVIAARTDIRALWLYPGPHRPEFSVDEWVRELGLLLEGLTA